jgi:O-antigen ligase
MYNRNFFFKSNTFKGFILIFFGSIIGGLLSSQIANSVSRALGSFVLLFGSIGFARLLSNKNFRKGLDVFFVLNLAFWTFYIFFHTFSGGLNFISYSALFMNEEVVNHHVLGINVSTSAIYVAVRYFYYKNELKIGGFLIVFLGILICFLAETRSNVLFSGFVLLVILFASKVKMSKLLILTKPELFGMIIFLTQVEEQNEGIYQRFDASDNDYQERTTEMRFEYIGAFFKAFIKNPIGKGVYGTEITSNGFESTLVHNQYLTFILSGGMIAFFGVILWVSEFIKLFLRSIKSDTQKGSYNYAILMSMVVFMLTLNTVEYSGLLFFLYASLLLFLSENYILDKIKSKLLNEGL